MFKPQHVYNQEPITWSEQLPCAHATAFSQTSLFLDQFPTNFDFMYQISLTNQSAKTGD